MSLTGITEGLFELNKSQSWQPHPYLNCHICDLLDPNKPSVIPVEMPASSKGMIQVTVQYLCLKKNKIKKEEEKEEVFQMSHKVWPFKAGLSDPVISNKTSVFPVRVPGLEP